ncbi:CBN-DNJ-7 protein [Caenorhabditis brenneri]|uniref:CBN-DNJ-7 protein n=1 Tax=Caenorhabditis brenneri TaxID=135651 RepID=G0N525_CAEBE|nr:CBN-DNJ-7 protein [Caenorhabditis brenneri]
MTIYQHLIVWSSLFVTSFAGTAEEVAKHLELGSQFLARAQFADALTQYHAAIELDPKNYQAVYRRATTYLAMGRGKAAIVDLERVLELKPDFYGARLQRANILLKQGELEAAENDYNVVLNHDKTNTEVQEKTALIEQHRQLRHQIKSSFASGDCNTVEEYINHIIEVQVWDATLYRMRAKCLEERGELKKAIHDMRIVSKLSTDSTDTMFETSKLLYTVGDLEESLNVIRECLKLNPDHKSCYPFYKKLRKVVKSLETMKKKVANSDWMACLEEGQKTMKFDPTPSVQLNVFRITNRCQREAGHITEAIAECNQILEDDPSDADVLCERAEAYLLEEDYDAAIEDYQKATEVNPEHKDAKEGLEHAKRLKTQAGKRDYYKILGVKRNANKREITKAYRKLAQKWHPDNFSDEEEKKKAEKKFIDIAAAKEVLQDEEKRRQFDQGIDPLDPEAQRQGGGHGGWGGGFPHGFHHFGGGHGGHHHGGGDYSFKFNWG